MLSDIVGTLLAFVTIMLLLSLLVTSLVQFTQATLRLRGRNLLFGIAALIQQHAPGAKPAGDKPSPLRDDRHLALAAHVLNNVDASLKHLAQPNTTARVLIGPPVSWVNADDLARAVVSTVGSSELATPAAPAAVAPAAGSSGVAPLVRSEQAIKQTFENMSPALSKRFQFIIRLWTVAWSFLIAFTFQLSTPELLKNLPSQDTKRQAILAAVPGLTREATVKWAFSGENILEASIARLSERFPQYKELFGQVSVHYDSKEAMLDEMRNVLGEREDRNLVLTEYAAIIDTLSKGAATAAYDHTSQLIDRLDTFGIAPKLDNMDFYVRVSARDRAQPERGLPGAAHVEIRWANIVGVLITGILLSLGAPFWFEQLKNLSSLRDGMNPGSEQAKPKPAAT